MKKTLVIVDFQNDFCHPQGSMYVKGAEMAEEIIVNKIYDDKFIDQIIITKDWHPADHCSFKEQDYGLWPSHCVQYTWGSEIPQTIENAIIQREINPIIFYKGNSKDVEEYGAFDQLTKCESNKLTLNNKQGNSEVTIEYGSKPDDRIIEVCGIAYDFCVKNTVLNLLKHCPKNDKGLDCYTVTVLKDCCPPIEKNIEEYNKIQDELLKKGATFDIASITSVPFAYYPHLEHSFTKDEKTYKTHSFARAMMHANYTEDKSNISSSNKCFGDYLYNPTSFKPEMVFVTNHPYLYSINAQKIDVLW